MYRILLSCLCFIALAGSPSLFGQCTPPMAETCDEANVLCSLDEVNGYACNNPSTIPSPCNPLCSQGGVGHNTSWWGFVTQGGSVTVTLTVGGCTTTQGLQFGIWGDCVCGEEIACRSIPCVPPNSVNVVTATLSACKTYYLWVDGCSGDICDFTLNTSGGGPPSLSPLGKINNKANMIIEPVCVGACNVLLFVNPQPGTCEPTYVWTLDGNEVGGNSNEVRLDFPDEGDFVICVTAYIGNPQSGSVCSQEGPQCATVKVRPIADKPGKPRTICWEQANPGGYKWHSQRIYTSGTYREQFTDANCCKFDSIVDFTVLDQPEPADVYYITCDGEPFIDQLGRPWDPCKNQYNIMLPKTTDPFKCDSSINLTAVTVDFSPRWRVVCLGGMVEISPNISIIKPCSVGETYEFEYRWYKCNDPNKTTISTDERLLVDAVDEKYCLDVNVKVTLETEFALCAKTFSETFNEGDLAPKSFPLVGDLPLCIGHNGNYWIDTFLGSQKVLFYTWTIDGGFITSKVDSQAVEVKWLLPAGDTGLVCVFYDTDCGKSPEKCIKVPILASPKPDAGPNDSICDKANQFQGIKDVGGFWTQIGGPGTSNISDLTDPKANVSVDAYGKYTYIYTENRLGCETKDTVELYFNSTPDSSGLTYLCNVPQTQYKLRFLIKGGTPPYTVVQGNGTIDANNFYNSNFYDNNTNYTILIRDVMGCILTFNFSHECKCTNGIGAFDNTPHFICEDQSFTFSDPGNIIPDPNDTMIFVVTTDPDINNAAGGTFIKMLSSKTVVFDPSYMTYGTTYYVFVLLGKRDGNGGIDFFAGCVQADGPKPFVFYQNPAPSAGPDEAICGTLYDLNGVQSISGSQLKWKLVSGTGVTINDDVVASTQVNTNGQYGTFVFELTEDNSSCIAADRVAITFNPSPFIAVDEKICLDYSDPNYPYKASVRITNGQPPYTIVQGGGMINGNIYMTDTLTSLVFFNVEIRDANGCTSNLIVDNYNCNCGSVSAGKLDSFLTEVCVDKCVPIKNLVTETLDPEDVAMYVLHQSSYNDQVKPRLDTFYSINDVVCFNPATMSTGTTYYLTRVVGNDTAVVDNVVDITDPCLRASNNQPIVWYPYPTPDAGPSDSICFYNYQLKGITNTGSPSWRAITPGSVIANPGSDVTDVTVPRKGTYRYELTEDFKGCISTATVDITYWDAPDFANLKAPECDNTAEHYRITVDGQNGDRPSWSVDGYAFPSGTLGGSFVGANTWQTDWILNNDVYRLIINDRHDCLPDTISDTYECPCINGIGSLDKTPIILCIDGTADAGSRYGKTNAGAPDGNDFVRYILFDGNPADPKNGIHYGYNANGVFTFIPGQMQSGKTYYIAVVMGNIDPNDNNKVLLNDRCLKFDVVPVIWYNYPVAAINGPQLLTCAVTNINLDGNLSISGSGAPLNYSWSTSNGNIVGSKTNNTANINMPGDYILNVTDPVSGCTNQISYHVNIDVAKPNVGIATPQVLTCDRTSVVLDGSASSQGSQYQIRWSGPGNITNGNTYTPSVDATGLYRLIVTNTSNGCVDSFPMNVSSDLRKPIPDIKKIGDLTCTVKQIQLDAGASKGQAGPVSSYTWQAVPGNIIAGLGTSKVTIDKAGTYQVLVKDQTNGCTEITNINVVEIGNPFAAINVAALDPVCFGERNGSIDVTGVVNNGPVNGLQYSLNNGQFGTTHTLSNLGQGTYHIKVRDVNGCEHDTTVVLVEPSKLGIEVDKSIVVDQDSDVFLDTMLNRITGGTTAYRDTLWTNLNGGGNWKPKLHYKADTTRDFLITLIDGAGCKIEERVRVIVRIIKDVWWPSAFSPNKDNINDNWNIKGKRVRNIRTLNIYDRWGEMVYSVQNIKDGNTDPGAGWKGVFNGENALPGVYVFYAEIEYVGSEGFDKYKGEFTLIR